MTPAPLADLEARLGHEFRQPDLLEGAMVHRSYTSEHPQVPDNERMEFLGDAVLQLAVTDYLYENHPALSEGEMAKVRAACVNRVSLAEVARMLDIGRFVQIGIGEAQSGGRNKDSILADTTEALLAAVYLDAGYAAAQKVILDIWAPIVDQKATAPGRRDFKTRLQEVLATSGRQPEYEVSASGPDHFKMFDAVVSVGGKQIGSGRGRSKKEAQQEAARSALEAMG